MKKNIREKIAELQSQYDTLEAEWDRNDRHGGNTPLQHRIAKKMQSIQEQIVKLKQEASINDKKCHDRSD